VVRSGEACRKQDKLSMRRGIMEAEAALNRQEPSPWIFPSPSDASKAVDAALIRYKRWYKVLRVAGPRSLKLHALRHTYASPGPGRGVIHLRQGADGT
jgi:integrase